MIFILAGNAREASQCALRCGLDAIDYRYLFDMYTIKGHRNAEVWLYGTYHLRPDYPAIYEVLLNNCFKIINKNHCEE